MEKNKTAEPDYKALISAFEEASKLSISFVIFPVIFLVIGVLLDKRFDTVPVFIISGVIAGLIIFAYRVRKAIQDLKKEK